MNRIQILGPDNAKLIDRLLIDLRQTGKTLFLKPMAVRQPGAGLVTGRVADSLVIDHSELKR